MTQPLTRLGRRLLGSGAVPAPPHVFSLDAASLRYGRFVESGSTWELRELRRVELPADSFQPGILGGPLREPAVFGERIAHLLGGLSTPPREASLVVPDAWLRVAFIESAELPRAAEARDEIVRWKVKRLLPFRVEDLRLSTTEVAPLPQQAEPRRLLVAYGLEALLAQLEEAFVARGVWIGRIISESLALVPAVGEPLADAGLGALAVVRNGGYTLLFSRRGEPVLYRYKSLDDAQAGGAAASATVERDLRLTRAFVADQLPDLALDRVVLAANPETGRGWQEWLGSGLGRAAEPIEALRLPLASAERVGWMEVAPMLGAARQEVW
jgi:type IV pilus assembly protein PilM